MAKGQLRSNRETRKPKKEKDKTASKVESPFGSQVKLAANPASAKPKGKT